MSYDIDIYAMVSEADTMLYYPKHNPDNSWQLCYDDYFDTEEMYTHLIDVGNMTWNVAPMYIHAMGISLSQLHSKTVKEVKPFLVKGIHNMRYNPDTYKAMNPQNGWGDYEVALEYLYTFIQACIVSPDNARVSVT